MLEPDEVTYRTLTDGDPDELSPFATTPAAELVRIALGDPDDQRRYQAMFECVDRDPDDEDTIAVLVARLDNLGKGASGAAVQAMNVHLGVDEGLGL